MKFLVDIISIESFAWKSPILHYLHVIEQSVQEHVYTAVIHKYVVKDIYMCAYATGALNIRGR